MGHPQVLVDLVQEHRYQRGLPVVAVNHVRVFAGFPQELDRGPGEKGVAEHIVLEPVDAAPTEEIVLGMGLDKEALAVMNEAEIDRAVDESVVPGDLQVVVDPAHLGNMVVAKVVMLGQHDLDMVAPDR